MTDYSTVDYSSDYFITGKYNLISGDFGTDLIYTHDGVSSSVLSGMSAPGGTIFGLTLDTSLGNLISFDFSTNLIYVHDGVSTSILNSFSTPGSSTTGIAYDDTTGNLISCDDATDLIYIHDGISASILSSFSSPGTQPHAIAFDPIRKNLISSDFATDIVYVHDGVSSSVLDSFSTPASNNESLAVDKNTGNLISVDRGTGLIYVHDEISSSIISSFAAPASFPAGLTVVHFEPLPTVHSYTTAKLIQPPESHGYTAARLSRLMSTHGYTPASLTQKATSHSYTVTRLLNENVPITHCYTVVRLTKPITHGYTPARLVIQPTVHGYTTFQLRAEGAQSYFFDLRDVNDIQVNTATGAPPQVEFIDLFTGVSDGFYTLYVRSVQKYKNLENTINETMVKFRLLAGVLQPLLPNLPLSVSVDLLADANAAIFWHYDPTNEETPPTEFLVYAGAALVDTVPYSEGVTSYSSTVGPLAEVSTVFGVLAQSGGNQTPLVTADEPKTPDGTPPETVPFNWILS